MDDQNESEAANSGPRMQPPPLTVEILKESLSGLKAGAAPTKGSASDAAKHEEKNGCGLMDDCCKNIINARMGKHTHLNFKVTLPPKSDKDGREKEAVLQFEYAAGANELQVAAVQKEKIGRWCDDRIAWKRQAKEDFGGVAPVLCSIGSSPLALLQ